LKEIWKETKREVIVPTTYNTRKRKAKKQKSLRGLPVKVYRRSQSTKEKEKKRRGGGTKVLN